MFTSTSRPMNNRGKLCPVLVKPNELLLFRASLNRRLGARQCFPPMNADEPIKKTPSTCWATVVCIGAPNIR